jgi:two-component system, cell cycle response regulator
VATRLARAAAPGIAYRMGGDEFCVLVEGDEDDEAVAAALAASVTEEGDGFWVTASFGHVRLGGEAATASAALRLADDRMYAQKRRSPHALVAHAIALLLRALVERPEGLERHAAAARLAEAAVALGLPSEEREQACAAFLRDAGYGSGADPQREERMPVGAGA